MLKRLEIMSIAGALLLVACSGGDDAGSGGAGPGAGSTNDGGASVSDTGAGSSHDASAPPTTTPPTTTPPKGDAATPPTSDASVPPTNDASQPPGDASPPATDAAPPGDAAPGDAANDAAPPATDGGAHDAGATDARVGDASGTDAAPPSTDGGSALTWTIIYNTYFATGTAGHCGDSSCHATAQGNFTCGTTKATCYSGMVNAGLINTTTPTSSKLISSTSSPLMWFSTRGTMPDKGVKTNPQGVTDITAWVNAGALNN